MSHASIQEIVCLLGQPVDGNPTQYAMEKAFIAAGLDWRFLTLEVAAESLADAVRGVRALGFRGANIIAPHKQAAAPLVDQLSEAVRLIGAVTCLVRDGDQLHGENTDGKGCIQSLRLVGDPVGKHVAILGAGRCARAIAVEAALAAAAEITIVNRSPEHGQALVDLLNNEVHIPAHFVEWEKEYEVPAEVGVLIHATTLGSIDRTQRVPVAAATLRPDLAVADVVCSPIDTRFLAEAKAHGCPTVDGVGMLAQQIVFAFRLWTGLEPDAAMVREALDEFLGV